MNTSVLGVPRPLNTPTSDMSLHQVPLNKTKQDQLETPGTKGGRESKNKATHSEFRSHTTSIQSRICFKADVSQLIYFHGHFSFKESLTATEEHAGYTFTDGHLWH